MFLRSLVCEIGFGMWRTIYRAASAFVPTSSEPAARMPLLHAKEVAEKVGNRLPYGRGSESARRVYSHLLSRDRQGAVVLVLFQQPLKRAPRFSAYGVNTSFIETVTVVLLPLLSVTVTSNKYVPRKFTICTLGVADVGFRIAAA